MWAFANCSELTVVECGEALMTLRMQSFYNCSRLERVALPLKGNMIEDDVFGNCSKLISVDLVGGTIKLLPRYIWRAGEMR